MEVSLVHVAGTKRGEVEEALNEALVAILLDLRNIPQGYHSISQITTLVRVHIALDYKMLMWIDFDGVAPVCFLNRNASNLTWSTGAISPESIKALSEFSNACVILQPLQDSPTLAQKWTPSNQPAFRLAGREVSAIFAIAAFLFKNSRIQKVEYTVACGGKKSEARASHC